MGDRPIDDIRLAQKFRRHVWVHPYPFFGLVKTRVNFTRSPLNQVQPRPNETMAFLRSNFSTSTRTDGDPGHCWAPSVRTTPGNLAENTFAFRDTSMGTHTHASIRVDISGNRTIDDTGFERPTTIPGPIEFAK